MASVVAGVEITREVKNGPLIIHELKQVPHGIAIVPDYGFSIGVRHPSEKPADSLTFYYEIGKSFCRAPGVNLEPGEKVIAVLDEKSLLISGEPVNRLPGLRVINTFGM